MIPYFHHLENDDREPLFTFQIPGIIGIFGFTNLKIAFWIQCFVLLSIQSIFNVFVAVIVYKFIVLRPQQQKKQQHDNNTYYQPYLIGYGIICPILLLGPLYIVTYCVELKNVAFMVCLCGAIPNLLLLRVVEAMHGIIPPAFLIGGLERFILYYAATLQVKIDEKTNQPVPFTRTLMMMKIRSFLFVFIQTTLLYSLLQPFDYIIAPTTTIQRLNIIDLYYWGNIVNAFFMASLTSLLLEGGATGLGLIASFCTGLTMETFSDCPLTQSSSPSDFWGKRWNRPVASALRRGVFRPLRKDGGCSRQFAAIVAFVISGFIHEYFLLFFTHRKGIPNNTNNEPYKPQFGNQFLFFTWNAFVLVSERALLNTIMGGQLFQWMRCYVPKPIRTCLVLMTVLPIAHLFTDEYVSSCFYNDAAFGFPRIEYISVVASVKE
ncbi:hypothetical protein FRACYDRAFT_182183 [Fragilariopsis cylindrus CCMP1102]|uniref:Wax synthase domain-containing protein n=1 Tax=Fragilariopsis cylindrus CCMP1102 TaxID=635003 RepID=A0A1E7FME9_9STRA|nr:hypothetical protein FRACYDRAFT_182183 [Fragilariopsis cylindrus CCMP1102]|eukprot:OEU19316.1 hypothetical protein FRACYDRAFT_182183 [Fragilariopsis cylindrus CCMP1102]